MIFSFILQLESLRVVNFCFCVHGHLEVAVASVPVILSLAVFFLYIVDVVFGFVTVFLSALSRFQSYNK